MIVSTFDRLERAWESPTTRRAVAATLVIAFAAAVLAIEAARRGLLPAALRGRVPSNPFRAIELAFWLLLAFEVAGLVFVIARSVANAAGKQFEIFSLILLRHAFEEFGHLGEPVVWSAAAAPVLHMLASAFGALVVFVLTGFYYSAQRHRPMTDDARDTRSFVSAKKAIALALLAIFAVAAGRGLLHDGPDFFATFYTVLVFADVLIVLLSLRYSASYHVVFRNSGLAVATVLLRLGLAAPPLWNAALGAAAAAFALALTVACNRFAPVLPRPSERDDAGRARLAG